jgi:hypothetical protein
MQNATGKSRVLLFVFEVEYSANYKLKKIALGGVPAAEDGDGSILVIK